MRRVKELAGQLPADAAAFVAAMKAAVQDDDEMRLDEVR
jgi:hypothetical protein